MLDDIDILKGRCLAKRMKIITDTAKSANNKKSLPSFFAPYV